MRNHPVRASKDGMPDESIETRIYIFVPLVGGRLLDFAKDRLDGVLFGLDLGMHVITADLALAVEMYLRGCQVVVYVIDDVIHELHGIAIKGGMKVFLHFGIYLGLRFSALLSDELEVLLRFGEMTESPNSHI